jgi:hypothetical protein
MYGQSLVEVLVALSIFVVTSSAAFLLFFGGQSLSVDSINSGLAADYVHEGITATRSIRDQSWINLTSGIHGLSYSNNKWQFSGTSDTKNGLTRTVTVTDIDANTKEIKTKVTWSTDPTRTQSSELVERLTNFQNIQASGGDTGGTLPTGNWCNPKTLGSIDLGPGNSATDLDVLNKIVYISATASSSAKPDLFIVDATDGTNPAIIGSLNTGKGLDGIDVAGNYAYVVGEDDTKEFQIVDISNHTTPVIVSTLNLPGNYAGLTVFYWNGYAYVGRANGAAQEFVIINVSNPTSPYIVSGLGNVGGEINDIFVLNNKAYLATEDDTKGMVVIDISNVNSPIVLGSMNSGAHVYSTYGTSESAFGVGGKTKFFMVNALNPASITTLGSATINAKINGLAISGAYAFLGTEDPNKEFQVWNVSNPTNITFCSSFNFPQNVSGIDYENNLVYVAVRSNDALRIITSQ